MEDEPWARLRTLRTDSKTAIFLGLQIPSILCKNSHKPEVSNQSLMGFGQYPLGSCCRKKREWKADTDTDGRGCRQEPLDLLASTSALAYPRPSIWGNILFHDKDATTDPCLNWGLGFTEPSTCFLSTLSCSVSHKPT